MILPEEYDVAGRVALITGAGRGIGRGIAEVLSQAGANVALNALTPKFAEPTARSISEASGHPVEVFLEDVTTSSGARSLIDRVLARFGRIDVLVNNLGDSIMKPLVGLPGTSTTDISDEDLKRVLDLNMTATLLCTRAVGPHMLERRSGKVINISSYTAHSGGDRVVLYTAAKTAVVGFTRAQALEWARFNVQVNSIAPGLYPEPLTQGEEGAKAAERFAARLAPAGRGGRLREVGLLALYLASAASDYMTGQTLYLDGGASLG